MGTPLLIRTLGHVPLVTSIVVKIVATILLYKVGEKKADVAMDTERKRRVDETLGDEEIKRRLAIANKLLDVQKELLATHKPIKV